MSQAQQILTHMRRVGPITPMVALKWYGCLRLAARIDELRRQGHEIHRDMVSRNGKRFASYSLAQRRKRAA